DGTRAEPHELERGREQLLASGEVDPQVGGALEDVLVARDAELESVLAGEDSRPGQRRRAAVSARDELHARGSLARVEALDAQRRGRPERTEVDASLQRAERALLQPQDGELAQPWMRKQPPDGPCREREQGRADPGGVPHLA